MADLVITRGLPGSGKTTSAREWVATEPMRARVNRDDLRKMLLDVEGFAEYTVEQVITVAQQEQVRALLRKGYDVVVDDTHLRKRYTTAWADLAREEGVRLEVWDFDVPLEVLIERNKARAARGERFVPAEKIRDLWHRFPPTRWPEVGPSPEKPDSRWLPYAPPSGDGFFERIWLVDIDGTVAKKRLGPGERGWHDYARVGEDRPNSGVIDMVNSLHYAGSKIVFMSGRKDYSREVTRKWLSHYVGEWTIASPLFMRADDDNRSDDIVKHELFHTHIQGVYDVAGAVDDRDRVVAMWRAIGLTVAQIDYGDF